MGWFWKTKTSGPWDLAGVERPWQGKRSIHDHIRAHISPDGKGLAPGGDSLPDETDDGRPRWVAGGLDGAFGHHAGGGGQTDRAKLLHRALRVVLEDASSGKVKKLYDQLLGDAAIDYIDPLLEQIVEKGDLDTDRLQQLAVWLARNSPDREPVKFAIALLGVTGASGQLSLLQTLGRHEEFTLYSAVAISNLAGADAEPVLFELARQVDGWGRIQIVERLASTEDPRIKAWMVREGYRNSIMYEYLAWTCATAGELRGELEAETVDPELLAGAGEIIQSLITGGPAENMDDYADGAVVVQRYLHHLGAEPRDLAQLIAVDSILGFLAAKGDWDQRATRGWTPAAREQMRARAEAIRTLPHWKGIVMSGLAAEDARLFAEADQAAKALRIDTWTHHLARLESGKGDGWFDVMQTDDPSRIDRVIALAEKKIPLDAIATGPREAETGLGPEWDHHGNLDWVLQDLRRFPRKGWPLIRAGIQSPVIRNRHMALRALSPWGKDRWPPDAEAVLQEVLRLDPDEDVREEIETLLAGKQIEEPAIHLDDDGDDAAPNESAD